MKSRFVYIVLLLLLILNPLCYALEFNAITLFGCDKNGTQNIHARWNTGPVDVCWDIFIYEGDIARATTSPKWINHPQSRLVKLVPDERVTTFTFHIECDIDVPFFGMNLFVAGSEKPAISIYAPVTRSTSQPMNFKVNHSGHTMGWPLSNVPAAGSASYSGVNDNSLWWRDDLSSVEYAITDFKVLTPKAAGNIDLVGPGETSPSGKADYIGQFTIVRRDRKLPPADWLLWTSTVAGMKIGSNNEDGTWKQEYDYQNAKPPFSFIYNGRSSYEFLSDWEFDAKHKQLDQNRIAHILTWQDPKTGLQIRWEGLEYTDFESIEWTVYLTNNGKKDTPIIENIKALDARFQRGAGDEYLLRHWKGTFVRADDFEPLTTVLGPNEKKHFSPPGGRGSGFVWPYYNLQAGGEGILIAVGWPGQWASEFTRDENRILRVQAGQETTHFKLLPGEMVRTPLIVLQFWKGGDWIDSQNTWRKWMIKHNIPKNLSLPMFNACSSHQFAEMTKANEQNQKEFIDSYLKKGLKIDYWWMDAGWYVGAAKNNWTWTGTWEVDRSEHRFPNGLRAISEHAHEKGVKSIVWFEPERVAGGTWLATKHPEWIIGGANGGLLNLGDPKAWNWLVNHIDKLITEEKIDLYRQDYNIDPLGLWRQKDTKDRQGITENKYVMGYLAYWDELRRRHPGMLIDSCASGGHRNDLETMRRSVPLLRSDYLFEPVGQQSQTYGLSFWLPFYGTGYASPNVGGWGWGSGGRGLSYDSYNRRSNMCPSNIGCFDFRVDVNDELLLKLYHEWKEIGPDYFGDFYPLTEYTLSQKDWIGWQFYRPDKGEGFVQAFRRNDCMFKSADLKLRGLDPKATYQLKNYDTKDRVRVTGQELMDKGISVEIPEKPGAVTIKFVKVK